MAKVTIPNELLTNQEGKPIMFPKRDADGEIVFLREPDADIKDDVGDTDDEPQDVLKIIRHFLIIFNSRFSTMHAANDSERTYEMWLALNRAEENGREALVLRQVTYDWLHRVFNRPVVLNKEAKDSGLKARSLVSTIFLLDSWPIVEQLKHADERKWPPPEEDPADDGPVGDGAVTGSSSSEDED